MTLEEVVRDLDLLDADATICVRRPWSGSAECIVISLDANLRLPQHVKDAGFEYFLERFVADEVLEVFGEHVPSNEEKLRLLIFYADNDAYPDWVYELHPQ